MKCFLMFAFVAFGVAAASEIGVARSSGEDLATAVQGEVAVPGKAGVAAGGAGMAHQEEQEAVDGLSSRSQVRREVAPSGAAEMGVPREAASAAIGERAREMAGAYRVRASARSGRVRSETTVSGPDERSGVRMPGGVVAAEAAGLRVAAEAPGRTAISEASGEERVASRMDESIGAYRSRVVAAREQALAETSNARVDEEVARRSPDRAASVERVEGLAVRKRAEELRMSMALGDQVARSGVEAILGRREVLAVSASSGPAETTARASLDVEAVTAKAATERGAASARVEVASGATLVHVSARNTSAVMIERPVIEIALPKGMRYEALASAPPNTAVRVLRTEEGETVEMVLPFALFQHEAAQVAVETSPLPEGAASGVRASVGALEERLRVSPEGAALGAGSQESGSASAREHLHPRP